MLELKDERRDGGRESVHTETTKVSEGLTAVWHYFTIMQSTFSFGAHVAINYSTK